jgi:hypothetical protein
VTENDAGNTPERKRAVSIRERSVQVGDLIVVNGARAKVGVLKERFAEGGYQARETPHGVLFTRDEPPHCILVHRLFPDALTQESARQLVRDSRYFGHLLRSKSATGQVNHRIYKRTSLRSSVK